MGSFEICRYEKLCEKIVLWEDKKTKKAKRKLHRTEVHLPNFPKTDSCINYKTNQCDECNREE